MHVYTTHNHLFFCILKTCQENTENSADITKQKNIENKDWNNVEWLHTTDHSCVKPHEWRKKYTWVYVYISTMLFKIITVNASSIEHCNEHSNISKT